MKCFYLCTRYYSRQGACTSQTKSLSLKYKKYLIKPLKNHPTECVIHQIIQMLMIYLL